MHPRCRSTISAVITEGTRVARNKGGRNIRVPADMTYADWKKVYIDKTLTLRDWQAAKVSAKIARPSLLRKDELNAILGAEAKTTSTQVELTLSQENIKSAEDNSFKATTGTDFGLGKIEPLNWQKSLLSANGNMKEEGRSNNCIRCVVANEALRKGLNAIARPTWGDADPMQTVRALLEVFENPKNNIRKCTANSVIELEGAVTEIMKSFGVNSRAILWFKWATDGVDLRKGHAIVAEYLQNGNVRFGDPQKGVTISATFLTETKLDSMVILRVDNLNFTDMIKRCCMNRSEYLDSKRST